MAPSAVYPGKKASAGTRAVGRYELKDKLGEGGMGVVWRALDSRIGGDVALKIMKDVSDPSALELFAKEWRALADLSHPNIVDVRDVDVLVEDGEQKPFFVMPLLRGATLSDLIKGSSERLTVNRVVEIISQVCRGLQAAHQRGLVHRDLKPSNIFVMDDDTAKVIDFGVVYLAGTHSITSLKGTYQYMSPEQVQMKEVTPASDLFSLGVILYEALTGRKPFARATPGETSQAVQHHVPPPVSELNPAIPHQVGQVVHKCLAKQAIHRFGSAKDLAETLQRACRGEEVFDSSKLRARLERVKGALKTDEGFASELLSELESEGHLDSEITVLRTQIDGQIKARKVRQLIQSARARIEQGEIALGLDKLREALELDPENVEAQALKVSTENRRSEAQAERWVELGRTHLDNCDFGAARHAVQEALASRAGDVRALELLNRIETVEAEAKRIREQKEQLYNTAMKAYQNGEIDSAMSRMVRLFSVVRSRPEGAVPERDAVYESFYQQVRSEHDSIRLLLEQAQHEFSEENFQEALRLCGEHLARYPHDGAFQALKIQIEDAERQKVSSYIAMVTKNADAEPDLDRRANILREASEKYPNEGQFAQQLKVVRERRDLVNSIVAKARQFQERGQYSEALSQWDMLRNIHPRYPGLSFELEQCKKKRDQQAEEEEKARLVEEIVRLMDGRDYAKALDRARLALQEYPGDAELVGLERLSADGLERSKEGSRLLLLGQAEAAAQNWEESGEYLRKALKLDGRNVAVKEALIYTLTEHARTVLESDWMAAQQLQQEASALDGQHRAVRMLGTEISEARRQTYVGECLTEARMLVSEGKHDAAYELIRKGRQEYPNDLRLEQYEAWLVKENDQLRVKQERERRLAELAAAGKALERNPDSERAREVLRRSRDLSLQAPDDPEAMRGIADAEQTVKRTMKLDDLSVLLRDDTEGGGAAGGYGGEATQATRLERPPQKIRATGAAAKTAEKPVRQKVASSPARVRARSMVIAAVSALTLLIVGTALLFQSISRRNAARNEPRPAEKLMAATKIHVNVTPGDSAVLVNGSRVNGGDVTVPPGQTVKVEISRQGYKTATLTLDGRTVAPAVVLEALPVRVSLALGDMKGDVALDGNKVAELSDGAAQVEVPADGNSHAVALMAGAKRLGGFGVKASVGEKPQLEPVTDKDMLAVASMGTAATVYGGEQLRNARMNGSAVRLSGKGADLPALTDGANELTYVVGNDTASLSLTPTDGPAVEVHTLGAGATMLITSNVDGSALTVNGKPMKRGRGGWQITQPGAYQFALAANGFETQTWTQVLKPRQAINDPRKLVAKVQQPPPPAAMATLVIVGGTPGAQVEVDGKPAGTLDANGGAQMKGLLSEGNHPVQLRKEGFCDVSLSVTARPPVEARLPASRLEACGSLLIKAGSVPATVTIQRLGASGAKAVELLPGRRLVLPAGEYHLIAEAAGEDRFEEDLTVKAGTTQELGPLQFKKLTSRPALACGLQTPSDASASGEWLKPNSKGMIMISRGCVSGASLTFGKPEGGLLKSKKMEWVVRAGGGNGQIAYEIDGGRLRRKSSAKGADEHAEASADKLKLDENTFRVRIQVEGQHIRILGPGGEVVDDYDAQDGSLVNLRGGQLGVKTGGEFKLSGGGA